MLRSQIHGEQLDQEHVMMHGNHVSICSFKTCEEEKQRLILELKDQDINLAALESGRDPVTTPLQTGGEPFAEHGKRQEGSRARLRVRSKSHRGDRNSTRRHCQSAQQCGLPKSISVRASSLLKAADRKRAISPDAPSFVPREHGNLAPTNSDRTIGRPGYLEAHTNSDEDHHLKPPPIGKGILVGPDLMASLQEQWDVYNQGTYKTELCNKWEEHGTCPYGSRCQFAHGVQQLRPVLRHPRYKTELCRMVASGAVCLYGHRCHFRHTLTPQEASTSSAWLYRGQAYPFEVHGELALPTGKTWLLSRAWKLAPLDEAVERAAKASSDRCHQVACLQVQELQASEELHE
eukprot:SM000017S02835  [mRNA]  locus=s17:551207:555719:- [translate_table: standard]